MKEYVLLPEDTIEVLPEESGAEAAVSIFCERTMILFPCSEIESLKLLRRVTKDQKHPVDCLCFTAKDALFETRQAVLVPITRQDYAAFCDALKAVRPELFEKLCAEPYIHETCDQTGSHLFAKS